MLVLWALLLLVVGGVDSGVVIVGVGLVDVGCWWCCRCRWWWCG